MCPPVTADPLTILRGVAFTHALVHGTHHRAQCLNMLRRLNVPGLWRPVARHRRERLAARNGM